MLVAHRLSTVVNADAIVVIDQGTAVEQGTHLELLARESKYADLVRTQLQRQKETADEGAVVSEQATQRQATSSS